MCHCLFPLLQMNQNTQKINSFYNVCINPVSGVGADFKAEVLQFLFFKWI